MTTALNSRPGKSSNFMIILAFVALAVGLSITLFAYFFTEQTIRDRSHRVFEQRITEIAGAIDKQLSLYLDGLRGFQGLYVASKSVERDEFQAYVKGTHFLDRFPGLFAVEFVERVSAKNLDAFIDSVKKDTSVRPEGYPAFHVFPEGSRPEYLLIKYVEPHTDEQLQLLGRDVLREPARWAAASRARDTGQVAITEPIHLFMDEQKAETGPAFQVYNPIYRNMVPLDSLQDRQNALQGYIVGVFRSADLIPQLTSSLGQLNEVDLEVFDGLAPSREKLLYDSHKEKLQTREPLRGDLRVFSNIDIATRHWTLVFNGKSGFGLNRFERYTPLIVIGLGVFLSIFIFIALHTFAYSRDRALKLADKMSADVRVSEAYFRALIAHAQDVITILSASGVILFESPSAERILGYTPEELTGKNIFDYMHPDDKAKTLGTIAAALPFPGSTRSAVFRFRHKNGSWRVLEAIGTNQLMDPAVRGLIINSRDITEREEAKQRIEESALRFSGLVSNIPGAVYRCACDSNWTMEFISDPIGAISGYPAPEFLDNTVRPYASLIYPEDRLLVEQAVLDAVERKEAYSVEYRITHADGTLRWVQMRGRGSFMEQGREFHLDGVIFDITGRKQVEEALQQREAQFRAISESSPLGLVVSDPQGHCTYANARYQEIAGTTLSECLGEGWSNAVHPDDRPRVYSQWYDFVRKSSRYENVHRFLRKNASVVWAHVLAAPMHDGKQLLGYVRTVEDITDRKRTEDELQAAYWNLKETQAQLTQSEKLASIGQLAAGVAHEVKNPLAIILQGVSFLDMLPVFKEGQEQEILEMMRNAVQRADRIIRELLDFARPATMVLAPVSLGPLIDSSLELVKAQLRSSQVTVSLEAQPNLPKVVADENQLRQVFVNLIINAFHAMSKGGNLTIRMYARPVTAQDLAKSHQVPSGWQEGQWGVFAEVIDTGSGIPKHLMNRIWDPFFTTKSPGQGTGLGLSITQTILESHRGLFSIESEEGRGTTVSVVLPASRGADG